MSDIEGIPLVAMPRDVVVVVVVVGLEAFFRAARGLFRLFSADVGTWWETSSSSRN